MNFSTETPKIQDFIKSLNLLDDKVAEAVRTGLHAGAEIIADEQRRIISVRSQKLPKLIMVGYIRTKKNGNVYCDVGYTAEAIKENPETTVLEFGRPASGKKTMKQVRYGKTVEVKIGKVEAYSHIRRGFDNKNAEAAQKLIDVVSEEIDKAGR